MGQKYTEKKKRYWRKKATRTMLFQSPNEKRTFKQKIRDFVYKVFGI